MSETPNGGAHPNRASRKWSGRSSRVKERPAMLASTSVYPAAYLGKPAACRDRNHLHHLSRSLTFQKTPLSLYLSALSFSSLVFLEYLFIYFTFISLFTNSFVENVAANKQERLQN